MRVRRTNTPKTWREAFRVYGRQLIYLVLFIIGVVVILGIVVLVSK